jgi:hypothetical protein
MDNLSYHLHPLVRGRNESFGLLFYNTRDTMLTFVRSRGREGDILKQVNNIPFGKKNGPLIFCMLPSPSPLPPHL